MLSVGGVGLCAGQEVRLRLSACAVILRICVCVSLVKGVFL